MMKRRYIACAFGIALLTGGVNSAAEARGDYFPSDFMKPSYTCSNDKPARSLAILSNLQNEWYSGHWAAAHEPSLYKESLRKDISGQVIRFTWLRSFHPPVVIRIEMPDTGSFELIAKQLSGKGGYAPGEISKQMKRPLTASETADLKTLLDGAEVFDESPADCTLGVDGAQWLIDGYDRKGYHFVDRFSPDQGAVHDIGIYLMKLTGWKFGTVY